MENTEHIAIDFCHSKTVFNEQFQNIIDNKI